MKTLTQLICLSSILLYMLLFVFSCSVEKYYEKDSENLTEKMELFYFTILKTPESHISFLKNIVYIESFLTDVENFSDLKEYVFDDLNKVVNRLLLFQHEYGKVDSYEVISSTYIKSAGGVALSNIYVITILVTRNNKVTEEKLVISNTKNAFDIIEYTINKINYLNP